MAILYFNSARARRHWASVLAAALPGEEIRSWPALGNAADITELVIWGQEPGLFERLPNLQAVFSLGAGANHILTAPDLPDHVPIIRLSDAGMGRQMAEYAMYAALAHQRGMIIYGEDKAMRRWSPRPYRPPESLTVGILGLGVLGGVVAESLLTAGYRVIGWSRRHKTVSGVRGFHGVDGLTPFLCESELLICMLPLTADTRNILNADLFAALPEGAMVVNVGRGDLLNEPDLLTALNRGRLSAAMLDVFSEEPLPGDHPFWAHPRIVITPHVAAETQAEPACQQIADNLARLRRGETPIGIVDRRLGY